MIYTNKGDNEQAVHALNESLDLSRSLQNNRGISSALVNLGIVLESQGDLKAAERNYRQADSLSDVAGIAENKAVAIQRLADLLFLQGKFDQSKELAMSSFALAKELGYAANIGWAAKLLGELAKETGDYKEALEMYELHIKMRDSIKNDETQKATIRQQTKYEFEKAQLIVEQEENEKHRIANEILKRRDNLQYSVMLICLLILGAGLLVLGKLSVPVRMAEGLIFFSFLIFFEFLLVLGDPYIDAWTGGAPGWKLLINAGIAAFIFPLHAFFESRLKSKIAD